MNDDQPAIERAIERLRGIQTDTEAVLESLEHDRGEVERNASQLEGPTATLDYIDFFAGFFTRVSQECGRIAAELPAGVQRAQVEVLRQLLNNSGAEQRRCLQYRDKWINKPLAYESMRPLLNTISLTTRDHLLAFRALGEIATELDKAVPDEPRDDSKTLDRRALLTRLFKPPENAP